MAIVSFFLEATDTFDAIGILHSKGAIQQSYVLLRKLLEIYFQIIFLLKGDSENKALAYEAYYESRVLKGKDCPQNIYIISVCPKYKIYKKEADRAYYKDKPKYLEWYQIYDEVNHNELAKKVKKGILKNIKALCKELGEGEENLYEKYYSILSKEVHGVLGRNFIKYNKKLDKNYIESFRYPEGITFQTTLCSWMIYQICKAIYEHYSVSLNESYKERFKEQIRKLQINEKKCLKYHSSLYKI